MRVFILDDEPPAVKVIKALLEQQKVNFPINIAGTANDPLEAIPQINQLKPEVLFLDVEMPIYNGFEVLKQLTYTNFLVVFITAYRDYAFDAFKANAFNYLMKPISPKAFHSCLVKIGERLGEKQFNPKELKALLKSYSGNGIAIHTKHGYEVIIHHDIVCVLSSGAYSEFHLANGKNIVQSKNLKFNENFLPEPLFKRISRSAIINTKRIASFSLADGGSVLLSNGQELFIGKTYRQNVFEFLKKKFGLS